MDDNIWTRLQLFIRDRISDIAWWVFCWVNDLDPSNNFLEHPPRYKTAPRGEGGRMKYKSIIVRFKDRDNEPHTLSWFLGRVDLNQLEIVGKVVDKEPDDES